VQRTVPDDMVAGSKTILPVEGGVCGQAALRDGAGRRRPDIPDFPTDGRAAYEAWATLPGGETLDRDTLVPTNDPAVYVFTKADELRNLYRIPLTR
jgi:hypothetical protein